MSAETETLGSGEAKLETIIGYLLIVGVVVSLFLGLTGMIFFYNSYGNLNISEDTSVFIQGENFFKFTIDLFTGEFVQVNALTLMTTGLVVLILIPYIRVVASLVYFAWNRNYKYVLLTLFVLTLLTVSLAVH